MKSFQLERVDKISHCCSIRLCEREREGRKKQKKKKTGRQADRDSRRDREAKRQRGRQTDIYNHRQTEMTDWNWNRLHLTFIILFYTIIQVKFQKTFVMQVSIAESTICFHAWDSTFMSLKTWSSAIPLQTCDQKLENIMPMSLPCHVLKAPFQHSKPIQSEAYLSSHSFSFISHSHQTKCLQEIL